ncbi:MULTISPECIES: hypothetical protein [unclassified Sphingobium]|uniref:hypothetical protein n=1 Tax=unclassified Sphingobium TaxID=2611147 RepID=UPI0035A5C86B
MIRPSSQFATSAADTRVETTQAERRRIDAALTDAWRRIEQGQAAGSVSGSRASATGRDAPGSAVSLAQQIDALMRPDIADSTIFAGSRSLCLLRHVADDLLPAMDMDEESRSIARALILEEIAGRIDCAQRRQAPD